MVGISIQTKDSLKTQIISRILEMKTSLKNHKMEVSSTISQTENQEPLIENPFYGKIITGTIYMLFGSNSSNVVQEQRISESQLRSYILYDKRMSCRYCRKQGHLMKFNGFTICKKLLAKQMNFSLSVCSFCNERGHVKHIQGVINCPSFLQQCMDQDSCFMCILLSGQKRPFKCPDHLCFDCGKRPKKIEFENYYKVIEDGQCYKCFSRTKTSEENEDELRKKYLDKGNYRRYQVDV